MDLPCPFTLLVGPSRLTCDALIFLKLEIVVYWLCNHHMIFLRTLTSLVRYRKLLPVKNHSFGSIYSSLITLCVKRVYFKVSHYFLKIIRDKQNTFPLQYLKRCIFLILMIDYFNSTQNIFAETIVDNKDEFLKTFSTEKDFIRYTAFILTSNLFLCFLICASLYSLWVCIILFNSFIWLF